MKPYKNFYARYLLLEITVIQFRCVWLWRGLCYSVFSKIFLIIFFSASIVWNVIKFYTQFTYIKWWHWYIFGGYSLLKVAGIEFFPKILRIVISRLLLNEIAQKFTCKIYIIRNNSDTFTCMNLSRGAAIPFFLKFLW